jgi:hypothetical protein
MPKGSLHHCHVEAAVDFRKMLLFAADFHPEVKIHPEAYSMKIEDEVYDNYVPLKDFLVGKDLDKIVRAEYEFSEDVTRLGADGLWKFFQENIFTRLLPVMNYEPVTRYLFEESMR